MLSNTVISETLPPPPTAVKKEASESTAAVKFEPTTNAEDPEKVSVLRCEDEKPQLPASVDSEQSNPTPIVDVKNESSVDTEIKESTIVLIQSAVRCVLVFSILYRSFDVSEILRNCIVPSNLVKYCNRLKGSS